MKYSFDIKNILKTALKLRKKSGYELNESICIFDLAQIQGLEVRFVEMTSMEGSILTDSKTILVSTFRPEGRIRLTCAHEIGHFVFKHGDHLIDLVDKINSGENSVNEKMCELFSSFLLMPESTVRSGFVNRGWDYSNPTPEQILVVSGWLGVGYTTLLNQMYYTMKIIDQAVHNRLSKVRIPNIKKSFLGFQSTSGLYVVDNSWKGRPIELVIGDYIVSEITSYDSDYLQNMDDTTYNAYEAIKVGESNIKLGNSIEIKVRIRRKDYTGRSIFRFLEE